jgi:hypothetical protein
MKNKIKWSFLRLLIIIAYLNMTTGCFYYKSISVANNKTEQKKFSKCLKKLNVADKYIIVHQGNIVLHLAEAHLNLSDGKKVSNKDSSLKRNYADFLVRGKLEKVDSVYIRYMNKFREKDQRVVRYRKKNEKYVITQVHIYVPADIQLDNKVVSIPLSSITKIDVYKMAGGATVASWTFSIIGIAGFTVLADVYYTYTFTTVNY